MDSAKSQLADKLKSANNVMVTVSRNPSVDQLASLLGLTIFLNKLGKHAAAVFSGEVPSTIEFLQPADTIEKNTDSLRDFIIALDKSKADKLRYKVEDNIVRIFITPYKTSITQEDLDFSQGDFNVDVVVALGVQQQEDLDEAITTHGRILHDATVASLTVSGESGLGTINWHDAQASSLCELVTELAQAMKADAIDQQIATALLTGVVAETARFSNDKTTAQTMSVSAALMAAGANQQLVASKLEEPAAEKVEPAEVSDETPTDQKSEDGTLAIDHSQADEAADVPDNLELPAPQEEPAEETAPSPEPAETEASEHVSSGSRLITEPPTLGGMLTANTQAEGLDPVTDPMSLPQEEKPQILSRDGDKAKPAEEPASQPEEAASAPEIKEEPKPAAPPLKEPETPKVEVPPTEPAEPDTEGTLADLEASVKSPHLSTEGLDAARDEVTRALNDGGIEPSPEPIHALNAQPLSDSLHPDTPAEQPPAGPPAADPNAPADDLAAQIPGLTIPAEEPKTEGPATAPAQPQVIDPNAPPPVPPPIPFQFGNPGNPPADHQ